MLVSEYLVSCRTGSWSVLTRVQHYGPYLSRQLAIERARAMAKADFEERRPALVVLEERGDMELLYDSTGLGF